MSAVRSRVSCLALASLTCPASLLQVRPAPGVPARVGARPVAVELQPDAAVPRRPAARPLQRQPRAERRREAGEPGHSPSPSSSSLSLTLPPLQIQVSVDGLPSLGPGEAYSCFFQDTEAAASLAAGGVTCSTPDAGSLPPIGRGDGERRATIHKTLKGQNTQSP